MDGKKSTVPPYIKPFSKVAKRASRRAKGEIPVSGA
jgi:hypothetical protein